MYNVNEKYKNVNVMEKYIIGYDNEIQIIRRI